MSGYVEAGYAAALGALGGYGALLVLREKAARRRVPATVQARVDRRVPPEPGEDRNTPPRQP